MPRKVFHSFHYARDWWRVQTVLGMGVITGQRVLDSNDWETVKRQGAPTIRRWINEQMTGRTCVVVLIGSGTAGRRWVDYEMQTAWQRGKGVVGVHVHALKDRAQQQSSKGRSPLSTVTVMTQGSPRILSRVAKTYDPPYSTSRGAYAYIERNLEGWIEEAIAIRQAN